MKVSLKKYYLVYTGLQRYRDGSLKPRVRVVRLGRFPDKPRIVNIEIDEPTRRGVVHLEATHYIPEKTYRRKGKRVHRRAYLLIRRFSVSLGDLLVNKPVKITTNPPKAPLMEFR